MSSPSYFHPNAIYCGDCLQVLRKFPNECVDMIYADPPFFSNRYHEVIWGDGYELRAFEDRWKGGINNYVSWMKDRLAECYRVLKPTGSMFLHCDSHASHYLKVEMDGLFGETNFVNEIIWKRQVAHSDAKQGAKHLGRLHDIILLYGKTENYKWNPQYLPYSQEYLDGFYKQVEPETGRRYALDNLVGPGGASKGNPYYEFMGVKRYWRYSKESMEHLFKEGRIVQSKSGNVPRLKRYLDEMPGLQLQDIWDDILPPQQNERLGYPTQKPVVLLERIIKIGSDPTDLILDPFCGCGTALAVAHKLGRQWIGIDVSPTACKLMAKRMRSLGAKNIEVMGMPMTESDLRKIEPFEFQNWVIARMFGRVSSRKTSDMGIDGYTFEGFPVQVKQSDDIGRNVVDNFETAIRRIKKNKGYIVAFSFGKGSNEEVARAKLHDNVDIELTTVSDLLKNDRTLA